MPERLECEVLQKARCINTLTFTFTFTFNASFQKNSRRVFFLRQHKGRYDLRGLSGSGQFDFLPS